VFAPQAPQLCRGQSPIGKRQLRQPFSHILTLPADGEQG
jgi:hypothetical protein